MESLSRPGSPTAPEYNNSNPSSRPSTPGVEYGPLSSPLPPRPGTPNPGGYIYAAGLDPKQDFQIIPSDSRDDAVATAVDSLSRMHLSPSPHIPNNNNSNDNNAQEPSEAALSEARQLAVAIGANPANVYARVKELYETHQELRTARFRNTGDTVMHRAVRAFVAQHVLGIFELLVLIELKADKNARNYANRTPLDLAKEASSIILVQLLEHPEPTLDVLANLAIEHDLETLIAWTLT